MNGIQTRITEYTEQYMEKVFYFCLRKCGDRYDAEDLTQDISLAILTELDRGVVPDSFPAWVWQIARNRYARFAKGKHQRGMHMAETPLEECELSDGTSMEEEYIHKEALSLLRRELAFISAEYRDIVVAYYIEDRSVKEIAASLSLPVGTVKARLFRARNILKEGMNMAREFGKRSYKPENITFTMSGIEGKNGEPYSLLGDLLSKNLLLSSYERPQTAEEIAIETGIALPYVQERLDTLVRATLMRKLGERYAPAFYIMSGRVQTRALTVMHSKAVALTDVIIRLVDTERVFHEANDSAWQEGYQAEEDTRWARLMFAVDSLTESVNTTDMYLPEPDMSAVECDFGAHLTMRPNSGSWELLGREVYDSPFGEPDFVGMHGCMSTHDADYDTADRPSFYQFKFKYHNIADATPVFLSLAEGKVLREIARGQGDSADADILRALMNYGYIAEKDGVYVPTFFVCDHTKIKPFTAVQKVELDALRERAKAIISEIRLGIAEMISNDAPIHLRDLPRAINFAISVYAYKLRGTVLEAALEMGYIAYKGRKNEAKERMLGAYLGI